MRQLVWLVLMVAWWCAGAGCALRAAGCILYHLSTLTTPFDAEDLASKILDLLADPAKRARFGERGRAKVLARYTWERVTDVWETTLLNAARGA